jgi:hypothetical protein
MLPAFFFDLFASLDGGSLISAIVMRAKGNEAMRQAAHICYYVFVHVHNKRDVIRNTCSTERLLHEFAQERERLQIQLSSAQHDLAFVSSQNTALTKSFEDTLAELVDLRIILDNTGNSHKPKPTPSKQPYPPSFFPSLLTNTTHPCTLSNHTSSTNT